MLARLILARVVHLEEVQAQGVRYDAEGAEAHRSRAQHRVERQARPNKAARGDGDADGVIEEGPEQVHADVADDCPG